MESARGMDGEARDRVGSCKMDCGHKATQHKISGHLVHVVLFVYASLTFSCTARACIQSAGVLVGIPAHGVLLDSLARNLLGAASFGLSTCECFDMASRSTDSGKATIFLRSVATLGTATFLAVSNLIVYCLHECGLEMDAIEEWDGRSPRWQQEARCLQSEQSGRRGSSAVPSIAVCMAATSSVASRDTWTEKLDHITSFAKLSVVSTISNDVSDVTEGQRRLRVGSDCPDFGRPHLLAAEQSWRCSWREGVNARTLIVHRIGSAERLLAQKVNVSDAWAQGRVDGFQSLNQREKVWAQISLQMQAGCLSVIEAVEGRTHRGIHRRLLPMETRFVEPFDMLVLLRADAVWLPSLTPKSIMAPSWAFLAHSSKPTILLPDVGDGSFGYNDRMAIMNRAAGPSYFRRMWLLTSPGNRMDWAKGSTYHRPRSSEELLAISVVHDNVDVWRFPNIAANSCCSPKRSVCRLPLCFSTCSVKRAGREHDGSKTRQQVLMSRVLYEGLSTTLYEDALASARSRLVVAGQVSGRPTCSFSPTWLAFYSEHSGRSNELRRRYAASLRYAFCVFPAPSSDAFTHLHLTHKRRTKLASSQKKALTTVPGAECSCSTDGLARIRNGSSGGQGWC